TEPEPVGGGDRDGRPSLPKDVAAGETPIAPDTGASVTFDEGRLVVELPAGALAEEGTLLLALIPASELPALPEGAITLASLSRVRMMVGATPVRSFSAPIRLTFRIDPPLLTDIPSDEIYGSYWDEGLQTWLALPTRIDPSGEIVVIVDHLTPLTVLHRPDLPVLTDIEDHWAEADTLRLVSLGAIEGYPDGTFRPEQSITRAEFVKLVAESLGLDSRSDAGSLFADAIPDWAAAS